MTYRFVCQDCGTTAVFDDRLSAERLYDGHVAYATCRSFTVVRP